MGWQRLGLLWREAQDTHSTQSCSPPSLSPSGEAWPCHIPHSVTPQHRGSGVLVQPRVRAGSRGRAPHEGLPKGCLVSSQVNLGLLRENPGQGGSWEQSHRPTAPLLLDGSGQQSRVPRAFLLGRDPVASLDTGAVLGAGGHRGALHTQLGPATEARNVK